MTAKHEPQFEQNIYVHLKDFFSSFRKCYEWLDSELLLARWQSWKIQGFGIFLLIQQFFDISILHF